MLSLRDQRGLEKTIFGLGLVLTQWRPCSHEGGPRGLVVKSSKSRCLCYARKLLLAL